MSLLHCIQWVLPLGNDSWQLVADLHAIQYAHCDRTALSIKKKYLKLANEQPSSGNPTMAQSTLLAKEIKEAINIKAGVTNPDVTDIFEEELQPEDELPSSTVPTTVSALTVGTVAPDIRSITSRRTKTNMLTSAINNASDSTKSSFEQFLLSKQMAEEFDMKQRRMEREYLELRRQEEREEDRKRREQEREDERLRREDERKRREEEREDEKRRRDDMREQMNSFLQFAVTGMMAFMGAKVANQSKKDEN
jgi:hypothetical protein